MYINNSTLCLSSLDVRRLLTLHLTILSSETTWAVRTKLFRNDVLKVLHKYSMFVLEKKRTKQKNKTKKKTIMEKVVPILIGHYTTIICSSETTVPIRTKPYRNIIWKSSIYNFHSAAINWKTKNTTVRTVPKSNWNIQIVERG